MIIIISKMNKVLFREPIHMCISQRGRLRKVQHRRVMSRGKEECLVLTPSHVVLETQRRQRHHWYFKDGEASLLGETKGFGAFRAIHTAHPDDSIRGFPLRSGTPIRPFRRGIRSNPQNPKQVFQLSFFHQEIHHTLEAPRKTPTPLSNSNPKNLSQILMQRAQQPQQDNQEQHQQFYKYKSPNQTIHSSKNERRKVAGSKIEPFKKYKIREVGRAMSTQRNRFPQILDE